MDPMKISKEEIIAFIKDRGNDCRVMWVDRGSYRRCLVSDGALTFRCDFLRDDEIIFESEIKDKYLGLERGAK